MNDVKKFKLVRLYMTNIFFSFNKTKAISYEHYWISNKSYASVLYDWHNISSPVTFVQSSCGVSASALQWYYSLQDYYISAISL